jgi:hypothetical protein
MNSEKSRDGCSRDRIELASRLAGAQLESDEEVEEWKLLSFHSNEKQLPDTYSYLVVASKLESQDGYAR